MSLEDRVADLAAAGRLVDHPITNEDILRGLNKDTRYALKRLIGHYDYNRDNLAVHVGDKVKVRKRYVEMGGVGRNNGWSGYSAMFSDEAGVVIDIEWNSYYNYWQALVEYNPSYRYIEYIKDFVVSDGASFYMDVEVLKVAR